MSLLRPTDDSPLWMHYVWMHFIVLIWGFTGALGRLIHVDALPLVWYRILLAAAFMALYAFGSGKRIRLPPKELLWTLVMNAAIIVVHWITFYHAIKLSNVSLTLACLSTGPFFTSLLEPHFFKRRILPAELILGGGRCRGYGPSFWLGPRPPNRHTGRLDEFHFERPLLRYEWPHRQTHGPYGHFFSGDVLGRPYAEPIPMGHGRLRRKYFGPLGK